MSATADRAGPRPARLEQQSRLQRGEGEGGGGGHGTRRSAAPVRPSTPDGMSQASTGSAGRVGRAVATAEPGAVGGVDHQVGCRQRGRRVGGVDHRHPHAPPAQPLGGGPAVGAVVALAGDDHHPAPVGAAQHPHGLTGQRGAGPVDQHLDRLRGGGVDRRHLLGGHDGQHRPRSCQHGPTRCTDRRRRRPDVPSACRSVPGDSGRATTVGPASVAADGPSWVSGESGLATTRRRACGSSRGARSPRPARRPASRRRRGGPRWPRPTPRGAPPRCRRTGRRRARRRGPSAPPPWPRTGPRSAGRPCPARPARRRPARRR